MLFVIIYIFFTIKVPKNIFKFFQSEGISSVTSRLIVEKEKGGSACVISLNSL
ncbi:hypothetical protein [Holospora elegans]|uniref:hypothetical protein n=1 Tax=Holospora elegans TaxID=431043 RepID=UPI00139F2967|nr:hypothetical protein [Holospora elegans]